MDKIKTINLIFQKFVKDKDIRSFRGKVFYYIIFRLVRNFLAFDIIIKIYNFYILEAKKNKTIFIKKCEFGDFHELSVIKKFSKKQNISIGLWL